MLSISGNEQSGHVSSSKEIQSQTENFARYCRPALAELLSAAGLDIEYHRAVGDTLYYYDDKGKEVAVTDFLGGYGSLLFGHNHPELLSVAISHLQSHRPFSAQSSCRSAAAQLAATINRMMNDRFSMEVVTSFANTGTEAVEAAIKHAELSKQNQITKIVDGLERVYFRTRTLLREQALEFSPDFECEVQQVFPDFTFTSADQAIQFLRCKNRAVFLNAPAYISLKQSFHGKTSGAVQLTYALQYRENFTRIGLQACFVEAESQSDLATAFEESSLSYFDLDITDGRILGLRAKRFCNISAMFIEPIQGEGGIHLISAEYLSYCRKIANQGSFHLVFDEIQSGMGRTGSFLSSECSGVVADYYLLSKSLGGGLSKISALIINKKKYIPEFGLKHTSTFGEDDFSCAIAQRALELLDNTPDIMQSCAEKGEYIMQAFQKLKARYPDIIADVRGQGLLIGIEFAIQENFGSITLVNISKQGDLPLFITSYLFHTFQIRVAPTLSASQVIRLEPSAYIDYKAIDKLVSAFSKVCEIVYKQNFFELCRFLVGNVVTEQDGKIKNYRLEKTTALSSGDANHTEIRKVGFIGHIIDDLDLRSIERSFENFTDSEIRALNANSYTLLSNMHYDEQIVTSVTGEKVALNFIGVPITSEKISECMKKRDVKFIEERIHQAVDYAAESGFLALGFGGFSSIIMNNCKKVRRDDIALTTGNALTVAMGIAAIYKTAQDKHISLEDACFASIGAGGNIGSIYSRIMAEKIGKIILIGRQTSLEKTCHLIYLDALKLIVINHNKKESGLIMSIKAELEGVALKIYPCEQVQQLLNTENPSHELSERSNHWVHMLHSELNEKHSENMPVVMTEDIKQLSKASLILSASNSATPLIYPDVLNDAPTVICDIAVPRDTCPSVVKEKQVSLIMGGVVKLPLDPDFKVDGITLPRGHAYACMSETLLMGLQGDRKNYSVGSLSKDQVKDVMQIASLHNFTLGLGKTEASY